MKLKIELSREEVKDIVKTHVLNNVKVVGISQMEVFPRENYGGWIVDIIEADNIPIEKRE